MTQSRQPISFIATSDAGSAQGFYGDVMGLTLVETSPYAVVFQDGDTMLRVQIVADHRPAGFTVHGWQVTDVEGEIQGLTSKGVAVLRFQHLDQDAAGIWSTPDGSKIAWFNDPDGNVLSFTQFAAP